MTERERLDEMLVQLHEQLKQSESLTDDERESLQHLAGDIQQLLKNENSRRDEATKFGGQLRHEITRFEADHPTMTILLGRIADSLSKIGI